MKYEPYSIDSGDVSHLRYTGPDGPGTFMAMMRAGMMIQSTNPVFYALHDHCIVPHRFAPHEVRRRDAILVRRGFEAAENRTAP